MHTVLKRKVKGIILKRWAMIHHLSHLKVIEVFATDHNLLPASALVVSFMLNETIFFNCNLTLTFETGEIEILD